MVKGFVVKGFVVNGFVENDINLLFVGFPSAWMLRLNFRVSYVLLWFVIRSCRSDFLFDDSVVSSLFLL